MILVKLMISSLVQCITSCPLRESAHEKTVKRKTITAVFGSVTLSLGDLIHVIHSTVDGHANFSKFGNDIIIAKNNILF